MKSFFKFLFMAVFFGLLGAWLFMKLQSGEWDGALSEVSRVLRIPFSASGKNAGSSQENWDQPQVFKEFDFKDPDFLKAWKEHSFAGNSTYEMSALEGQSVLKAASQATSSAIFHELQADIGMRPLLIWEWKVAQFPAKEKAPALADREFNDFAARLYAVFKGDMPFRYDVIQYVWDERFAEGDSADYSALHNVRVLVIQQGPSEDPAGWVAERRDLARDYELLFGKKANRNLMAVGFMSDSDNTKSGSEAYLKTLRIEILQSARQAPAAETVSGEPNPLDPLNWTPVTKTRDLVTHTFSYMFDMIKAPPENLLKIGKEIKSKASESVGQEAKAGP